MFCPSDYLHFLRFLHEMLYIRISTIIKNTFLQVFSKFRLQLSGDVGFKKIRGDCMINTRSIQIKL